MKAAASRLLRYGLLLATVLVVQSCGIPGEPPKNTGSMGTGQPLATKAAAPSNQTSSEKTAILPDASVGLASLKAYHAFLQIEAAGSLDGLPFQRSMRVEITRAGSGDFDSQIQSSGGQSALRLLALGGAYYRWTGMEPTCRGSIDPPADEEVVEPAALLPPLGIASRVGIETVNQVSVVHYRFDQSALPYFKSAGDVAGDVWVAENGGYVLRYRLTAAAPPKPSGQGLEASQTYQYELTPDSPSPALPKDCTPVPVDLPVVDGAQNINRAGGLVTFDTASKPRAVIDFYQQSLPALGWEAQTATPAGEVPLPIYFDFVKGGLRLTVDLTPSEDQATAVALIVVDAAAQAAEAPHPTEAPTIPSGPLPTIDPAESGLPSNVPLYPGATSLLSAGGAVMFSSADPWQDVAGYYRQQLQALGWTVGSEQSLDNGLNMIWNQGDQMLILNILTQDGQTQIVVFLQE